MQQSLLSSHAFETLGLLALPAFFVYDALRPVSTIAAWIRACLTIVETFSTVVNHHLLARNHRFPFRMVETLQHEPVAPFLI